MELFYRKYGAGKPLIILHGILGISDNWVSFGKKIAKKGFQVIIPDQRNHGHSPHSNAFNYYALVDDLAEFIDDKEIERPILLGHSMGGKVAMRYTLENTESVDKIIVVDVSLRTYVTHQHHRQLIESMQSIPLDKAKTRKEVEEMMGEKINSERIKQFLLKNLYWKEKKKLGWRINLDSIHENLDVMYDGVHYSTRFPGPALFVRGGKSDYVLNDDFQAIQQSFPHARIHTIENGTHWVHADEPAEFFSTVSDFLLEE